MGYDWTADHVVTAGAPTPPLFPAPFDRDLDGALLGQQAFTDFEYVFQGGNYQRIKLVGLQPDGDPASTADNWFLPSDWTTLDAVFPGGGVKSGFAYFFRGPDYMRFDWPANAASVGYPKPIGPNWHTSGDFTHDLDGEITGLRAFGAKAYLFRTVTTMVNRDGRRTSSGGFVVNAPVYCRYDFNREVVDNTVTDSGRRRRAVERSLSAARRRTRHRARAGLDRRGRNGGRRDTARSRHPDGVRASLHDPVPRTRPWSTRSRDRLRQFRERLTELPDRFPMDGGPGLRGNDHAGHTDGDRE
ncbi:hypothetical protein GCM10017687_26590 [Streptomyces echinatus]|uniref:hemopexin repeat-containing protein n=1 Tax=Streptomyces echinatus TaxID=67293 RepID=UPI0031F1A084